MATRGLITLQPKGLSDGRINSTLKYLSFSLSSLSMLLYSILYLIVH